MTDLTLKLSTNSPFFAVETTNDNGGKRSSYYDIGELSNIMNIELEKSLIDTGLMPLSLIFKKETATSRTFLFHNPLMTIDYRVRCSFDSSIVRANPELFETFSHRGDTWLILKNLNVHNVGFAITQDKITDCCSYKIGTFTNVINGRLNPKTTKLQCTFGNHFDENICWHSEFDKNMLSSEDVNVLELIPYHYFTSLFNSDLSVTGFSLGDLEHYREFRESVYSKVLGGISDCTLPFYMAWLEREKGVIFTNQNKSYRKQSKLENILRGSLSNT